MATTVFIGDVIIVFLALYFSRHKNIHFPASNIYTLFIFICLIGLLIFIFQQGNILMNAREQMSWPTTTAVITESKVIGERAFRPDIVYKYEVEGMAYQGETNLKTPGFGNQRSRHETAEYITHEYKKNKIITVYYNPNNPSESFVRPGPQWSDYMKNAVGHILFIITLFFFAGTVLQKARLIKNK